MNDEEIDLDQYYDFDEILDRLLDTIPDSIDKREGSIIYDALAPAATEIARLYLQLKFNQDLLFVDTAVDEYLDRLCNQIGLKRKEATNAIWKAKFYDEDDNLINIDLNSRFSSGELTYKVISQLEQGIYTLQCEISGIQGNTLVGELIPIDYIEGLGRAELVEILENGTDKETDDELRNRYFENANEKSFSGNISDYKNKTKNIIGVGAVKVIPCWNGGGTVKLIILDSDFNKASNILIQKVQNEICPNLSEEGIGLAPIRAYCNY